MGDGFDEEWTIGQLVGARLKEMRQEAEMTQRMIAEATGIHRPVVARIEGGSADVTTDTVIRYAEALDLHPDVILVVLDKGWRERFGWRPDEVDRWKLRYSARVGRVIATRKPVTDEA